MSDDEDDLFFNKAINFNDLSDTGKTNQMIAIYYDFLECDPVPMEDAILCPFQPLSPNCVGLDVVIFTAQQGDGMSIDYLVSGKVVAQSDGQVQINIGEDPYTLSVFNCAVLH